MSEILYIKPEKNTEVSTDTVYLKDVCSLTCTNPSVVSRCKAIKLYQNTRPENKKTVFSILKVIELIQKEYPSLEIQNMGAQDFVVLFVSPKPPSKVWEFVKAALVCGITFFGSAFSIMTFNNDVGVTELFQQFYEQVMGRPTDGFSILELTYSLGLTIGVIVFFNHFSSRKLSSDPTPIEVEMRLYEDDIMTTLTEDSSREGKTVDVD